MKTYRKQLSLFIAATSFSLSSTSFAATPTYTVADLGVVPYFNAGGGTYTINSVGVGAGAAYIPSSAADHAYFYNGVSHDLGTLGGSNSYAYAVNTNNIVVGSSDLTGNNATHAFLYDNAMHDIGTLGGSYSSAQAINASNRVVGESSITNDEEYHAFLYDGSMHDLGTLGGGYSRATAINDNGIIAGSSGTIDGEDHAFLYDGTMHDLGSLGGFATATTISSNGIVGGYSFLADNNSFHGFLYYDGMMHDLGTFGGGDVSSVIAVNKNGWAVGWYNTTPGEAMGSQFIFDGSTMYDLNLLLATISPNIGVYDVLGINDNGEIFAMGYDTSGEDVNEHLFRLSLTPVPLPASAWLFGSCLTGLIGLRRKLKNS